MLNRIILMKDEKTKYNSCAYYAYKGNQVAKEFFDKKYPKLIKGYIEPEDSHSVYDIQIEIPLKNKVMTYYIEVKLKFNNKFYSDNTFITKKKIGEINEFMEHMDNNTTKFLYLNYYPMIGKLVLFNIEPNREYRTRTIRNWSATANLTDIEPHMEDVVMCLLPMDGDKNCKVYDFNSLEEIEYNNNTYVNGEMMMMR